MRLLIVGGSANVIKERALFLNELLGILYGDLLDLVPEHAFLSQSTFESSFVELDLSPPLGNRWH